MVVVYVLCELTLYGGSVSWHCMVVVYVLCELALYGGTVCTVWVGIVWWCELAWLACCGCTHNVFCHCSKITEWTMVSFSFSLCTKSLSLEVTMPPASQDPPVCNMLHSGSSSSTAARVSVLYPPVPLVPSAHPPRGMAQPCGRTVTVCGSEWRHCLAVSVSAISLARLIQWTKIYVVATVCICLHNYYTLNV